MAWIAFNHPSRKRLLAWLEHVDDGDDAVGGHETDAITQHVDDCERCAGKLEELAAELDGSPSEEPMGAALRSVYEPPPGINERVMKKIDERKRSDRELRLFLGIFAIPTDAADLMMPDLPADGGLGRDWEEEE